MSLQPGRPVILQTKKEGLYNGKAVIDGEEVSLATGDWLKISPAAKRQFFAASDSGITYVCIQVKENGITERVIPFFVLYSILNKPAAYAAQL